ncbi:amino acid racemase [Defluviimonas sp. WL0050]|uniref:Amino acid racemase n=1 Tax=Albidovulum litorale TaxID=2984134 RepID=A0ABT2ZJF5_9RHOB|nr:amino acid racemase [Defluviimonas sp. WL0050]MCV2871180.1 amino acid racemase [Defluviimonas sp. WL0050]
MRRVGILGGMGPDATVLLMQKVIAARPAADDADHIPLIVHQNPQVPSRIKALIEGTGENPGPVLAAMARDLERAGAEALAMPCNTAHAYAPDVKAATGLPFLDMIEATAADLSAKGVRRVGMLASPAVRIAGVFGPTFAAKGLEPVWSDDEDALLAVIRAVKAGRKGAAETAGLERLARGFIDRQNCDHLAVACTELSILMPGLPADLPLTDTLDCLVTRVVEFAVN